MRVAHVRRYPVKSAAGESPAAVEVDRRGVVGDRLWAVVDADGKLASGKNSRRFRRMDPVFDLVARLPPGRDVPEVAPAGSDGWIPADAAGADAWLSEHMGRDVGFRREGQIAHMDAGQVSLVGTATLAALGDLVGEGAVDPRRFRVNLVIETETPWIEESWVGQPLRVGGVVLEVARRITRCRMVDIAQDGVPERPGLMQALSRHRDLELAVYADVVSQGRIRVGDAVSV